MAGRLLKLVQNPHVRFWSACGLFAASIILGTYCTLFISKDSFEKVLMAISWGAITITCVDIMATTDVRKEQEA